MEKAMVGGIFKKKQQALVIHSSCESAKLSAHAVCRYFLQSGDTVWMRM